MNNTIVKSINILKLLSANADGLSITEISKTLNQAKSTVFDIVHTLDEHGLIEPSRKRPFAYQIGLELFRLGYSYMNETSLDSVARPILEQLSQDINETVFMALRSGQNNVVYTMKFLSNSELQTVSNVGSVRHFLSVALGKAILAALPDSEALACVTEEMYRTSSIPEIYDAESLISFLDAVRERGYVIDSTPENSHFVRPVAAPILDLDNHVLGAVSIVAISEFKTEEQIHKLGKAIQKAALEISHRLGYQSIDLYAAARKDQ